MREKFRWLAILWALFVVAACGSLPGGGGVGGTDRVEGAPLNLTEHAAAERLRVAFPAHAERLLGSESAFVEESDGFAVPKRAEAPAKLDALELRLPRMGQEAIAMRAGELAISVREIGAGGEGALAGSAVVFPRESGTSVWTATPGGFEEWLHLDASAARGERTAATWVIEGASVQQAGEGAEIVDEANIARIRVTAPAAYAKSGRAVPVRLEVTEARIALVVDGEGEEVLVDPAWTSTASMITARVDHAATLLQGGKVLVTGGQAGGSLTSAERYDPASDTWSLAASMTTARSLHTATLLPSGKLLVAGGFGGGSGHLASAELYDPASNTWSLAASMTTARYQHTATLLPSGKVLVAGGDGGEAVGGALASAELYDPASNTWSPAASMATARLQHTAATLLNGKVLVASGKGASGTLASAELYDPAGNTWSPAGSMTTPRDGHTAARLLSGKVLVAGGQGASGALASAEIYDPAGNTWSPAGSMATARSYGHTATLLGGEVLVAGGQGASGVLVSAELYNPSDNTWSPAGSMATARLAHTATLLPSGEVLLAGGQGASGVLASAERYGLSCACAGGADANGVALGPIACGVSICGGGNVSYLCNASGQWQNVGSCPVGPPPGCACTGGTDSNGLALGPIACGDTICGGGYVSYLCNASGQWQNVGSCPVGPPPGCACTGGTDSNGLALGPIACGDTICGGGYVSYLCNASGQWQNVGACASCTDGVKNAVETDVDCGGGACPPCALALGCSTNGDCASTHCVGNHCVQCVAASTCPGSDTACQTRTCVSGTCGFSFVAAGTPTSAQATGDCKKNQCGASGAIVSVADSSDLPVDNNACTGDVCTAGVPSNPAVPPGTACNQSGGAICDGSGSCVRACFIGGTLYPANAVSPANPCQMCNPGVSPTAWSNQANGTGCDDGSACTQTDTCQSGACVGGNPVVCGAPDPCHVAGSCNPATGVCSNPAKANGAACDDGHVCTQGDSCQAGACVGTTAAAGTVCRGSTGACDPAETCTGASPDCPANALAAAGTVCRASTGACDLAESCNGTSAACPADGHVASGTSCDDGDACTTGDTCHNGSCYGSTIGCSPDPCYGGGGSCVNGSCQYTSPLSGNSCDDGDACTTDDTCHNGSCYGSSIDCSPPQCYGASACVNGGCQYWAPLSGSSCDDGDPCTAGDTCHNGSCYGSPSDCPCDDGNPCTVNDTSHNGYCSGDNVCGLSCSTYQPGVCAAGTIATSNGALFCSQNQQPSAEICGDQLDNDCDGQVDEGCNTVYHWTFVDTYYYCTNDWCFDIATGSVPIGVLFGPVVCSTPGAGAVLWTGSCTLGGVDSFGDVCSGNNEWFFFYVCQ